MKTISIRLDDDDYTELDGLLDDMGMTKQTFYAVYTKTALRERRIPFTIAAPQDLFYSEENQKRLKESVAQAKQGKIVTKSLEDLETMAND
jgi:DNA-damage-inducible protein J